MRKNPAFAVTAVLTLALGIGANTADFFTVVKRGSVEAGSAYPEPERLLVRISGGRRRWQVRGDPAGALLHRGWGLNAFTENVTLSGVDGPEPLKGARVTGELHRDSRHRAFAGPQLSPRGEKRRGLKW